MGISSGLIHSALLGGQPVPAAPAFLLDALGVSAVRAYSMRKLTSGYAGSAIRVRESGGNTEADIGFDASGNLDTAALAAHVGANSGFLAKWYDQSGNADDMTPVSSDASYEPRIVNAGTIDTRNSLPAARFIVGGLHGSKMLGASSFTIQEVGLVIATAEAGPTWPSFRGAFSGEGANGNNDIGIVGYGGQSKYYDGGPFGTISVDNGANTTVFGSVLQNVNGNGASAVIYSVPEVGHERGDADQTGHAWDGWMGEVVAFSAALSAGNRAALYSNQRTYWGTP